MKLGAAQAGERRQRWTAAPTTTGRASTARWPGSGKRDGKVYARNQRLNAPQAKPTSSNLADLGWAAVRTRLPCEELPDRIMSSAGEATVKNCGVAVARPQGHSWAPPPVHRFGVNVGTTPMAPFPTSSQSVGGKARCPLIPLGWDGEAVVVRGRESRPHGEGPQRARSINAD